jgi:hypothetical protein
VTRAGIILGHDHKCRRCGHVERHSDSENRKCAEPAAPPKTGLCGMRMWPVAVPRPMRFNDLRGGTLLARAGVPLVIAQRILRHVDPRPTANIYTRVDLGDMRTGLDKLGIVAPEPPSPRPPSGSVCGRGRTWFCRILDGSDGTGES